MLNSGRIALVIATVAAIGLAGWWVLVQVQARAPEHGSITAIAFHQEESVEGFDDGEYTQTDAGELAQFERLLDEYHVVPGETDLSATEACPGSLVSELEIQYSEGDPQSMTLTTCGAREFEQFNREATALVSQWRTNLAAD